MEREFIECLMQPGVDPVSVFTKYLERPEWMTDAACRGRDDLNWHPTRGEDTRAQVEVCRGCVVRNECLDYAFETEPAVARVGIWGGYSAKGRRQMAAGRETPAA